MLNSRNPGQPTKQATQNFELHCASAALTRWTCVPSWTKNWRTKAALPSGGWMPSRNKSRRSAVIWIVRLHRKASCTKTESTSSQSEWPKEAVPQAQGSAHSLVSSRKRCRASTKKLTTRALALTVHYPIESKHSARQRLATMQSTKLHCETRPINCVMPDRKWTVLRRSNVSCSFEFLRIKTSWLLDAPSWTSLCSRLFPPRRHSSKTSRQLQMRTTHTSLQNVERHSSR